MSYVETFTCRVAIQVCIGYFPDGRKRTRTFSMRGIRPDASVEAIAEIVRALAPLLIHPIIKVRKVVKRTIVFDAAEFTPAVAVGAAICLRTTLLSVQESRSCKIASSRGSVTPLFGISTSLSHK